MKQFLINPYTIYFNLPILNELFINDDNEINKQFKIDVVSVDVFIYQSGFHDCVMDDYHYFPDFFSILLSLINENIELKTDSFLKKESIDLLRLLIKGDLSSINKILEKQNHNIISFRLMLNIDEKYYEQKIDSGIVNKIKNLFIYYIDGLRCMSVKSINGERKLYLMVEGNFKSIETSNEYDNNVLRYLELVAKLAKNNKPYDKKYFNG